MPSVWIQIITQIAADVPEILALITAIEKAFGANVPTSVASALATTIMTHPAVTAKYATAQLKPAA